MVRISSVVGDQVGKAASWIESVRPGSVVREHVAGAAKPQSLAPRALLQAFLLSTGTKPHTFVLRRHDEFSYGTTASKHKLRDWLLQLPTDVFADVHEHFAELLDTTTVIERIKSITDSGVKKVYDLTIPGPEHFVASGFVVHNCKHVHRVLLELYQRKM